MARKIGVGIQNNMGFGAHGKRMDLRSTEEVEKTRESKNMTPFRSKQMKEVARERAYIPKSGHWKGTYVSDAPKYVR